jgi:hypothetical protein
MLRFKYNNNVFIFLQGSSKTVRDVRSHQLLLFGSIQMLGDHGSEQILNGYKILGDRLRVAENLPLCSCHTIKGQYHYLRINLFLFFRIIR